ncbi:MAG: DUF721 domain-containing protein [Fibromonadaceae bacterium]|jgi:hypothetical protein|nr:DUF721 domain-containing protein [Fibromonadaceae bacterium]
MKRICDEPLGIGSLAMDFLNTLLSQEQKDIITLNSNKAKILPGKLQEKINIAALSRETLILKAGSSVWRSEAMAVRASIIAACNKVLGKTAVKSLRFG